MAAELLEGIEELRSRVGRLNAAGLELELDVDLFNESGFDEDLNFLNLPHDGFSLEGEPANYRVVTSEGEVVDLEAVHQGILNGDLTTVLKELKFSEEELPPKVQEYVAKYKAQWETRTGTQDLAYINEVAADGRAMEEAIGVRINNAEQLEAVLRDANHTELKTKFEKDVNNLLKKFSGRSKASVGKWIKRGILLSAAGFTLAEVWKLINDHKDAMNGCWMINHLNGEKCKIANMSKCGKNDPHLCTASSHVCGKSATEDCFREGKCVILNKDGSCKETFRPCTQEECSKYCGVIDVPKGYSTYCVNVNFWGAANDFFSDVFTPRTWFRWIVYAGIAVVVVVILFVFLK